MAYDPRQELTGLMQARQSDGGDVLLLNGRPGEGKTTVIQQVAEGLPRESLDGFHTEEVCEHGRLRGFRAVTLDG